MVNSTALKSALNGGPANDTLTGGSAADTLTGAAGADVLKGMSGNDQLFARDLASDTTIDCGAGTADKADLDVLPKDPNSSGYRLRDEDAAFVPDGEARSLRVWCAHSAPSSPTSGQQDQRSIYETEGHMSASAFG